MTHRSYKWTNGHDDEKKSTTFESMLVIKNAQNYQSMDEVA